MIVIMAGLPGTGKSTVACELAKRVGGTVISKDLVRHALFEARDVEYSTGQDDFCMEVMLQTAQYVLHKDARRTIFLDGRTFSRRYQIDRVLKVAEKLAQPWRILECRCSDDAVKRRLEPQSQGQHVARNRDYQLYLSVRDRFEEITLPKTIINTDSPLETCIHDGLLAISSGF